jgi:hypothetical protein
MVVNFECQKVSRRTELKQFSFLLFNKTFFIVRPFVKCSTTGETRNTYRALVGKPQGKRPLGKT